LNREWIPRTLQSSFSKVADLAERFTVRRLSGVVAADGQLGYRFKDTVVPVAIIENYPILEEFPNGLAAHSRIYSSHTGASFGGVSTWTAIEPLVHAIGMLPENLEFELVLGGRHDSEELLQRVAGLPGWSRVDYQGPVQRENMIRTLSRAGFAVVLYKYKDRGDDIDIRSNRFFEALAARLPVITSNFSRWRHFVDDTGCGLAVDPDKPAAIAEAIQFLIEHPEKAEEMGRRGYEVVRRKYSWDSEEAKLLTLYAQLTNGHKR
jgi:glycosyltransferase involved in cell wall biosynthesis